MSFPEIKRVAAAWQSFWFTPQSSLPLCLLRWFAGGMILYTHLIWSWDLNVFFGDQDSWQPRSLVDGLQSDQSALSFWWYVPPQLTAVVHVLALVILALFWIGWATPVTSWLTFLIVISYANRAPLAMYGLDQINTIAALYLAIGHSGAQLSLDAWRRKRQGFPPAADLLSVRSGVALRLIQVHLCFIYLWSGLGKLQGESWWSGEAVWLVAASLDYQSNDLTWIASLPWLYQILSVGTWVWEVFFAVLIWRPGLRLVMLAGGVLMHLGIGMFMGMWTFGLAMIFLYAAFLPAALLLQWGQQMQLIWDRIAMNELQPDSDRRQRQTALACGAAITLVLLLVFSLLRPDDQSPQMLWQRGQQQLEAGDLDRAIQSLDQLLDQVPDHVLALHARGLAHDRQGDPDSALADYNAAIEWDGEFFEAINDRGILLLGHGQWEAGVADFRTLMALEPMNLTARVNYAFAMQKAGHSDEAAACLAVIADADRDSTVYYLLGCLAQEQLDWAIAEQRFSQAIELDDENLKAWLNRALCRYQLGNSKEAAADLQRVASLDEDWMLQGTIAALRERFEPTDAASAVAGPAGSDATSEQTAGSTGG